MLVSISRRDSRSASGLRRRVRATITHSHADPVGSEAARCWGSATGTRYAAREARGGAFLLPAILAASRGNNARGHSYGAAQRRSQLLIPGDDFDAFIDRGLDRGLEGRIPQKLFGCIEFGVELPLAPGNRLRQIPRAKCIGDPTCSAPAAHPFDIALQFVHFLPIAPVDPEYLNPEQNDLGEHSPGGDDEGYTANVRQTTVASAMQCRRRI